MSLEQGTETASNLHEFRLEKDELGQPVRLWVALSEADVAKAAGMFVISDTAPRRESFPLSPAMRDDDANPLDATEQEFETLRGVMNKINDVSKAMIETLDRIHGVTKDITSDLKAARLELAENNRGH